MLEDPTMFGLELCPVAWYSWPQSNDYFICVESTATDVEEKTRSIMLFDMKYMERRRLPDSGDLPLIIIHIRITYYLGALNSD